MSEFLITPNFEKKTACFSGAAIAAGEHVSVRVVGAGELDTTSLRLRVVSMKKPLAEFPLVVEGNSADEWTVDGDDLTATLNLNTVQMLKFCRGFPEREALFVLDDAETHVLYFTSFCTIQGWPLKFGEDAPVDLDGYADLIADLQERVTEAEESIRDAVDDANGIVARAEVAVETANAATSAARSAADDAEAANTTAQAAAATASDSASAAAGSAASADEAASFVGRTASEVATAAGRAAAAETNARQYAATAQGYRNEANNAMTGAQSAASEAQGNARSAETYASEAAASAERAEDAVDDTETAQTAAETAQGKAETAQEKAEDAQEAAETAQGKAEDAQTAAEAAAAEAAATVASKRDRRDLTLDGWRLTKPDGSTVNLFYRPWDGDPSDDAVTGWYSSDYLFHVSRIQLDNEVLWSLVAVVDGVSETYAATGSPGADATSLSFLDFDGHTYTAKFYDPLTRIAALEDVKTMSDALEERIAALETHGYLMKDENGVYAIFP